jgi:glycosyltransferase involved in cell wall biosynthesis
MKEQGFSFRAIVGGDGDMRPHYEALSCRLGLEDVVTFAGYVSEACLAEFYNSVSVLALPSTDRNLEGFGLVALEAMACGRPVVVSDAAGIASFVEESGGGVVVPARRPDLLAQALIELLGQPATLAAMGRRAREAALRRSWDRVAEMHLELYQSLLAKSRGP